MIGAPTLGGERSEASDCSDNRPFDGRPPEADRMPQAHLREFRLLAYNSQAPARDPGRGGVGHGLGGGIWEGHYYCRSRLKTDCGVWLAMARTLVPALTMICALVKLAVSWAKSRSRMLDSAAVRFSVAI